MITVMNLDVSNVQSVQGALEFLGEKVTISNNPADFYNAQAVIIPGVGSFNSAIEALEKFNLRSVIPDLYLKGTPVLGICLGMQILFSGSEESPFCNGLGLFFNKVKKIQVKNNERIPHMQWSKVYHSKRCKYSLLNNPSDFFYFSHSFAAQEANEADEILTCEYGGNEFIAAIRKGHTFGCQFHPEKSGETGLSFIKNFLNFARS